MRFRVALELQTPLNCCVLRSATSVTGKGSTEEEEAQEEAEEEEEECGSDSNSDSTGTSANASGSAVRDPCIRLLAYTDGHS